jgi:hypothetical protein
MATLKTQPVLGDLGSQEVYQLMHSYNHLLDVLGTMITAMKTTAGFVGDLQTIATTAETALQANVFKLREERPLPAAKRMPLEG